MITSVSSTIDTTAADASMKKTSGLNKDDFLQLFVEQLKNQDPMNPQDSSQFIAQLAQLTQVEQSYNANMNLQSLLQQGNNNMSLGAVSFIGGQVQAHGNQVSLTAGTPSDIYFNLAGAANQVTVSVQDSTGATVKSITSGATSAGDSSVTWDGTDSSGKALPSGAYSFTVSALDSTGTKLTSTPMIKGVVSGVDLSSSSPTLNIGSITVPLYDVTKVSSR